MTTSGDLGPQGATVRLALRHRARAEEAEIDRLIAAIEGAYRTIRERLGPFRKGTSNTVGGRIDCPQCGLKHGLAYRRSGYNGHVGMRCDTPGCLCVQQ